MEKLADVKWVHSHEEDNEGYEVYRHESYNFPPSRGRRGFKFMSQNDFVNFEIAPTDGIITRDGQWETGENKQCLITFEDNPEKNYTIEIIEQRKKLLKVKIIHN